MGTSQYAIVVESVGVSVNTSFVHLRYSYSINLIGRLAVNSYLATVGKDKVGFSKMEGPGEIAKRAYVQGVRGMVERNSMRYYLAILAHLHARSLPESARMQAALDHWFAATERFPAQLHESSRSDYLAMKLDEIARQRTLP